MKKKIKITIFENLKLKNNLKEIFEHFLALFQDGRFYNCKNQIKKIIKRRKKMGMHV